MNLQVVSSIRLHGIYKHRVKGSCDLELYFSFFAFKRQNNALQSLMGSRVRYLSCYIFSPEIQGPGLKAGVVHPIFAFPPFLLHNKSRDCCILDIHTAGNTCVEYVWNCWINLLSLLRFCSRYKRHQNTSIIQLFSH